MYSYMYHLLYLYIMDAMKGWSAHAKFHNNCQALMGDKSADAHTHARTNTNSPVEFLLTYEFSKLQGFLGGFGFPWGL